MARITFNIDDYSKRDLERQALKRGKATAELLRELIERFLKRCKS